MKKLMLFMMLIPLLGMTACDSDNNLPDVDLSYTLSNVAPSDGTLYAVEGFPLVVESVNVSSNNGNAAALVNLRYYVDGALAGAAETAPFKCSIPTGLIGKGPHRLTVTTFILQVDKSISTGTMTIPFTVVGKISDIPGDVKELGTYTDTFTVHPTD